MRLAIEYLELSNQYNPNLYLNWYELARAYESKIMYQKAAVAYENAFNLNDNYYKNNMAAARLAKKIE